MPQVIGTKYRSEDLTGFMHVLERGVIAVTPVLTGMRDEVIGVVSFPAGIGVEGLDVTLESGSVFRLNVQCIRRPAWNTEKEGE